MVGTDRSAPAWRATLPYVSVIVLVWVIIMFAAGIQGGFDVNRSAQATAPPRPVVTETMAPLPTPTPAKFDDGVTELDTSWYRWALWALLAAVIVWVLYLARRSVKDFLARSRDKRRAGAAVGSAVMPGAAIMPADIVEETSSEEVAAAALTAQEILEQSVDPGDGIIAAWIAFEEAVQKAGRTRSVAETPAEFVVRVVGEREQARTDTETLLRLYEDVRFGSLAVTDADRTRAKVALQRIAEAWR